MKNTLENKAKFFAQYLLQRVLILDKWAVSEKPFILEANLLESATIEFSNLLLKTLSSITPKEQGFITSSKKCNSTELIIKSKIGNYFEGDLYITDFLRSKGYALPYMGLSVETMVEYGWVKLS